MNKRGASVQDLMFITVGFLTLSITIILMFVFLTNFNTEWQQIDEIPTVAKKIVSDGVPRYLNVLDKSFLFLVVGSAISLFFGAAVLRTNAAFFLIGSFILGVVILISMFIQDTYTAIVSVDPISVAEANFTVIPFIFSNLPTLTTVTGFLILIGLYMKVKQARTDI